jgi:hypothetical protein
MTLMEQILIKTLEQSPMLALMLALVWIFLQHMKGMQESHSKRTDEFISAVKEMKDGDRSIIKENTEAGKQNTDTLSKLTIEIVRMSDRLSQANQKAAKG